MLELLLATGNEGKANEISEMLAALPVCLRTLKEFDELPIVPETGISFQQNAAIKASAYAKLTGLPALADDSGLEVPAIGNLPGVRTARFAGENASDTANISKLLDELKNFVGPERAARFVCEMALSDASGKIVFRCRGTCNGMIAAKPFGHNGFGYDPVFIPEGHTQTFGELPEKIKKRISHRSKAMQKFIDHCELFLDS